MANARPNLAGTITATVSAMRSSTAGGGSALTTPIMSFAAPSGGNSALANSAILTSQSIFSDSPISASTTRLSNLTPAGVTSSFQGASSPITQNLPASAASVTAAGFTTSLNAAATTTATGAGSNTSMIAAHVSPGKTHLSTSAIAGIGTASVIVLALLFGYLAYFLVAKRKRKQTEQKQRFSSLFPPSGGDEMTGKNILGMAWKSSNSTTPNLARSPYVGEVNKPQHQNLWQKNEVLPKDIGVAVPAQIYVPSTVNQDVLPEKSTDGSWPSLSIDKDTAGVQKNRWSTTSSFEEDLEAQPQDVYILRDSKDHSIVKSYSDLAVAPPAPLRLSKIKASILSPSTGRIPLTPVYDNGTFDRVDRMVFEAPVVRAAALGTATNFSRGQLHASQITQDQPAKMTIPKPSERYSEQPRSNARQQSEISTRSISIYTEIEEDDTPDKEENKQLGQSEAMKPSSTRSPLKDLQWPQMPRSASVAKQAVKPHIPRKPLPRDAGKPFIGTENILQGSMQPPRSATTFLRTESDASCKTESTNSSMSPVFPMPPTRAQPASSDNEQSELVQQISDAYKAASSSAVTKETLKSAYYRPDIRGTRAVKPRPGEMYQTIQRLGTQKSRKSGSTATTAQPAQSPLPRSASRAKLTPITAGNGDWYLTVGELGA